MPGQKLEIKAGVGAFSKAAKPTISIGGTVVPIGEEGFALKEFDAGGMGSHSVPVTITYFNQTTGQEEKKEVKVDYVVGSANASIALDKMNVLYIGVDNPVTIAASGGGDDKVNVGISGGGGSISRVGAGKYVVRVSQQSDNCRITVNVEGKVAGAAEFRVRQIPGAQATIGGFVSGDNVPAGTFRAQGGVAAWIKDFPFDLKYTVTQFTLSTDSDDGDIVETTCTGNAFNARAQEIIRTQVKTGKTVYIDNIRVLGEDGQNKKVPSLVYYIK
jgi:gliding motility-associated protein GldM